MRKSYCSRLSAAVAVAASCGAVASLAASATAAPVSSAVSNEVTQSMQAKATFVAPGPKINIKSLHGKTIWYIPISAQIPTLAIEEVGLKAAARAAGLKLQICDGQLNPSDISACLTQALNAKAGAVIADSIDRSAAANQFAALQAAKIPALLVNDAIPTPNSKLLSYSGANQSTMMQMLARWIVVSSKGKANTLFVGLTDGKALTDAVTAGERVISRTCASCKNEVVDTQSAKLPEIPSLVSSTLLRYPAANYVVAQVDSIGPQVIQGVSSAGKSGKVQIGSMTGQIPALDDVKGGSQAADVAADLNYEGWLMVDGVMREMLGQVPRQVEPPYRLFVKANIGSVSLTAAAQNSGVWFGARKLPSDLEALWTK